jgi:hypothetical protein
MIIMMITIIKDYNLEPDQINDIETLKQCSDDYDYNNEFNKKKK